MTRTRSLLVTVLTVPLLVLATASPALAATLEQKVAVLTSWTQTSAASQNAFLSARSNQGAWSDYGFDWSTDYCSDSPDNPLGFDFKNSCARHDFGYRNHKALGLFTSAVKSRVDSAFYEDLKRKCSTYSVWVRPACSSLAWTYYQAVKAFGSLAAVKQSDLDKAAALKAQGLQARESARAADARIP
ncbi:phospholipase [Hamadaea tsunoensis]|uniref:phospholipase n=1 Tax=Hamadaea tsunoensis TaxID=53368 RepID=UPI00047F605F|nr:phospholipase [Hamadaea tsunoensis]